MNSFKDDGKWYDWALVEFEDVNSGHKSQYASRIGCFVKFMDDDTIYASIVTSAQPVTMTMMEEDFVVSFEMTFDDGHFTLVEISSIAHPLFVFEDYGGPDNKYFCVLPRRRWGRFFGRRVIY